MRAGTGVALIAALGSALLALSSEPVAAQLLGERGSGGAAPDGGSTGSWLPGPVQAALAWVAAEQAAFGKALREAVVAYRDGTSLTPALALIGLSFAYGIFHAVGPGHGKAVVTSFFLARDSVIRRGLAMGWTIAMIQAAVAILVVAVLGWVLDFSRIALLESMPLVELASYALIMVLGAGMVWAALTGRDCGHDHGHAHAHDPALGHGHEHAHGKGHGTDRIGRWEFLGAAAASGLRPCTGALIVLLFALANGIFLIGALATVAMGVGVALTVSAIGVTAILARRGLVQLSGFGGGTLTASLPRALSVLGSILVFLIGLMLFAATVTGGGMG
jgi:ABC-type nickel/cobalt efflux system permease component RcnA